MAMTTNNSISVKAPCQGGFCLSWAPLGVSFRSWDGGGGSVFGLVGFITVSSACIFMRWRPLGLVGMRSFLALSFPVPAAVRGHSCQGTRRRLAITDGYLFYSRSAVPQVGGNKEVRIYFYQWRRLFSVRFKLMVLLFSGFLRSTAQLPQIVVTTMK